ncbi:MAG: hypothetical protein ABSB95_05455 [Dissulfurispiraceae bacterium]
MIRKEKTYKFLAIAYNVDPQAVDNRTSRLMRIKAFRSDTAEKIANKRIERLEKQTGCKWTLHSEPGKLSDREERKLKALRFLSRANDYILESIKSDKYLRDEIDKLTHTEEYASATNPERMLIKIELLRRKLGDTELLREAGELVSMASSASAGKVRLMEIKLKAKYKKNVRAKHLLKLMKLANSLEQTKQTEAVKVFMFNLAAAGPVDVVTIPKNVDAYIAASMFEVIRLKSQLFEESIKTGKKIVMLADYFDIPTEKTIRNLGPTERLIKPEAFAKALGAEEIKDPKVIAKLKHIREDSLGHRSRDEGLGDIYNQVWEKIRKKLRHTDFKIHLWVPGGYRGNERADDIVDITVDTKEKKAKVKCKDGHIIEFGYDPEGRFYAWAHGAKVLTPEEAKFFVERQAIRDKLIEDHRSGKITDKAFEAAMDKDSKICDKELRRRWKELQKVTATGKIRLPLRKGGVNGFEGAEIKGKSITKTILKDRR